jgi:hypothetical protein
VVRWLFERFGGFQFAEGALYDTPTDRRLLFGAFLSGAELPTAFDVDLASGAIALRVHDAPLDRNVEPVAHRRRSSSDRCIGSMTATIQYWRLAGMKAGRGSAATA